MDEKIAPTKNILLTISALPHNRNIQEMDHF
jgi:hypothetical protein